MKRLLIILMIALNLLVASAVIAQPVSAAIAFGCNTSGSFLGLPPWYEYIDVGPKDGDPCAIIGPVDGGGKLDWGLAGGRIGLAVVDIMLRIGAVVAVVFVFYGGFRYILSQGEPDNTRKARGTVLNAIIGLVITLVATAAVTLVGNTLTLKK